MPLPVFSNNPDLKPKSLEDEVQRDYTFIRDGQPVTTSIFNPVALHVSKSGGHRVLDAQGVSHYIPSGWVHLAWKVKEGKEAFTF